MVYEDFLSSFHFIIGAMFLFVCFSFGATSSNGHGLLLAQELFLVTPGGSYGMPVIVPGLTACKVKYYLPAASL